MIKYLLVKPTYIKGGSWLKLISHSNLLCTRAIRTITNHTFIGEYYLRFFLRENFDCSCKTYPIESRYYILHRYRRYNNYWNLDRESLSYFIIFLKYNSGAFFFIKESLSSSFSIIFSIFFFSFIILFLLFSLLYK